MKQAYSYIKRLLVFAFCSFLYFVSQSYLSIYLSAPALLLSFSVLHSRITGEKPPHLFAFYRTDDFFKKGGLRDLLRIFVTLFGFLYDTVIWVVWGIFLVFILFIDLIDFLKFIAYWIIHAIIWILRQYAPFVILLYRLFIHYIIRWTWWLYQLAYYNIRYAFNKNSYRIALTGTLIATGIVFIFYYVEILLSTIPGVSYIGYIIALLPLTWSFGEIAMLRVQKMEHEDYLKVKLKFQNGIEAVRSILFYITLFVVLLLVQLGLNLLGWIPRSGLVLGSFVFNINNLISILLIAICVLTLLGVVILPSYRLYSEFSEIKLKDSLALLRTLGRKCLQYFFVALPNSIFSAIVIVIPLAVLVLAAVITFNIKNGIADSKINQLKTQQANASDALSAYKISKKVEQLESLKQFPLHVKQEIEHRKILETEIAFAREDVLSANEEALRNIEGFKKQIGALQKTIIEQENRNAPDSHIKALQKQKSDTHKQMKAFEQASNNSLMQMQIDIQYLEQKRGQIPLLLFFGGLWAVIFGSLALAFVTSFLGNVFHQVYIFRNDANSSEWMNIVKNLKEKDHKQPLLGGTLFIITALVLWMAINGFNIHTIL